MKNTKLKEKRGITLIALVITIIVMLILVAVTINMAVHGGLFGYAGNAARQTNEAIEQEKTLGDVEPGLTTEQLIDKFTKNDSASGYGLSADKATFIGQKSIGKICGENEDNTQKANWDASKNGYVFSAGHFAYRENYRYYDPETDSFKTGNVYLCWDADGLNPALRESKDGTWDIYSPEGAFLSNVRYSSKTSDLLWCI